MLSWAVLVDAERYAKPPAKLPAPEVLSSVLILYPKIRLFFTSQAVPQMFQLFQTIQLQQHTIALHTVLLRFAEPLRAR